MRAANCGCYVSSLSLFVEKLLFPQRVSTEEERYFRGVREKKEEEPLGDVSRYGHDSIPRVGEERGGLEAAISMYQCAAGSLVHQKDVSSRGPCDRQRR